MAQMFGNFIETEEGSGEYLKICFHPSSAPLRQRWRNNGLSADFLADYLSTFFPGNDASSAERQAEIKDAISYIANELLENAMKFSYAASNPTVSIEMTLEPDVVSLYAANSVDPSAVRPFQKFIERVLAGDPNKLYLEQLERNAESDSDDNSGLGFLTILNDYGASLAWKFTDNTQDGGDAAVTTLVRLPV